MSARPLRSVAPTALALLPVAPIALALLLLPAAAALAQDKTPVAGKSKLERLEEKTLSQVADDLLKLSRAWSDKKAYPEAALELARGLRILESKKLQDEEKRLAGKSGSVTGPARDKLEGERKKAHEKCALALADLALAFEKEGQRERHDHYVQLIREELPDAQDKAHERLGIVWFAPYLQFVSREDAQKLEAGGESVDGSWLDKGAVAALDRKHASWSDPWKLSDDVHEVSTVLPLRTARRLLQRIGLYRAFVLKTLGDGWDLHAPAGKLPVIVTQTQAELQERIAACSRERGGAGAGATKVNGAAYYMQTNGSLDPCFVTFEPTDVTGRAFKVDFDQVLLPLQHELTHQICFEYSKNDYDNTRQISRQFWSVEAIAQFLMLHTYERGQWRLTRPRRIPMGGANEFVEGPFAYCVNNVSSLPSLSKFFAQTHEQFMTVENYHMAATVAYFLLTGENQRYRKSFLRLLETVHRVRDDEKTFETCFEGIDLKQLQKEFLAFVGKIPLDKD